MMPVCVTSEFDKIGMDNTRVFFVSFLFSFVKHVRVLRFSFRECFPSIVLEKNRDRCCNPFS